jgi:hypothetical protein
MTMMAHLNRTLSELREVVRRQNEQIVRLKKERDDLRDLVKEGIVAGDRPRADIEAWRQKALAMLGDEK